MVRPLGLRNWNIAEVWPLEYQWGSGTGKFVGFALQYQWGLDRVLANVRALEYQCSLAKGSGTVWFRQTNISKARVS